MARVIWQDQATDDLDQIIADIRQFSPIAATKMGVRLRELGDSLVRFPDRGRPAGRFRELVAVKPYIIRYSVNGDVVTIRSIRHSRRHPLKS